MKKSLFLSFLALFQYGVAASADLEDTVRTLNGKVEELEHEIAQLKQRLNILDPKFETSQASGAAIQEVQGLSVDALISKAKKLIKNDQFKDARDVLNAFIQQDPKHAQLSVLYYYIAKSYLAEKNYAQAADAYMDSYQAGQKGSKTTKSLYNLAKCFLKLGKKEQASATLEKLILMKDIKYSKKAEKLLKESKK